jgi:hypothetical protein
MDAGAKEAAVARFLREHPQLKRAACDHPALLGCADVDWSQIPGCHAGIPVLLRGLLDEVAGPEALRVLGNVLMNSFFHVGAAMPAALPFLVGLAAVPDLAVRPGLVDLLVVAAELSSPSTRPTNAGYCYSGTTAITRNAKRPGRRSPLTLPRCARCWRTGLFRTDRSARTTASACSGLCNRIDTPPSRPAASTAGREKISRSLV